MHRSLWLASKLFTSSVLGQLAVLGAISLAASRMTPSDFAAFGVVTAVTYVLASVNTLAAELRSPVVSEPEAVSLTRGGLMVAGVSCAVMTGAGVAILLLRGDWGMIVVFASASGFVLGVQQLLSGIVLREQRQELLARNRLVQALSNAALILVSLTLPFAGWVGLALAWLVSMLLGDAVLAYALRGHWQDMGRPRRGDLSFVLAQVRLQPVANLMASSTAQLPVLALQLFGASSTVGAWALVSRFLQPAVNTAVSTLQPIYTGRAAYLMRRGAAHALASHHRRWTIRLAIIALPAAASFSASVTWLIPSLGEHWDITRAVLVPALLHFTSIFVCLPLSQTLVLVGRPNAQFIWTTARLIGCATPLALTPILGPNAALTSWAGVSAFTFLVQLVLHRRAMSQLPPHQG